MTYKEKKLKEFNNHLVEALLLTDDKELAADLLRSFLSSTIDEILGCLPEKAEDRYTNEGENYFYRKGFEDFEEKFLQNLEEKAGGV